ncbi:MAG: DUF1987 domain-containing protein [Flavobacteriales bacterium]
MEPFILESNDKLPFVSLDPNGDLLLKGCSFPLDATRFYEPILEWMEEYKKAPSERTVLRIDLSSFNIGSSKYILYMIHRLQDIVREGGDAAIEWVYEKGDEDMKEVGEDYEIMARIPFVHRIRSPQKDLAVKALASFS